MNKRRNIVMQILAGFDYATPNPDGGPEQGTTVIDTGSTGRVRVDLTTDQKQPYTYVSLQINFEDDTAVTGTGFSKCAQFRQSNGGGMADDWNGKTGFDLALARAAQELAERFLEVPTRHIILEEE